MDAESSPLLDQDFDPDQLFTRALETEMEKISSFYQLKELEIYGEVEELAKDEEDYENEGHDPLDASAYGRPGTSAKPGDRPRSKGAFKSGAKGRRASTIKSINEDVEDSDDDDDETTALQASTSNLRRTKSHPEGEIEGGDTSKSATRRQRSTPDGDVDYEDLRASTELSKSARRNSNSYDDYAEHAFHTMFTTGVNLKKRAIGLYVQLCELKSFVQLNKTGFTKVLKKYDKILDRSLKSKYIETYVTPAYPFRKETMERIDENIRRMEQIYAGVVTQGDIAQAKKELRLHLREHVVWERNTVWREMIGIERKAQAAAMGVRRTLLGHDGSTSKARLQGDEDDVVSMKEIKTPVGRVRCPTWLFSSTMFTLLACIAVFFAILFVPIMDKPEQQNCLAMVVFVSLLWATEVWSSHSDGKFYI